MAAVTVIVPLCGGEALLPRALASLLRQEGDWECVVVDDGAAPFELPDDPRFRVVAHGENRGLGAACNTGLREARAPFAAYLPADDVWFAGHLAAVAGREACIAAAEGERVGLVRLAHRVEGARWLERDELETDDHLAALPLAWERLDGPPTCAMTDHPARRTRALRGDLDGGPATFRARYGVRGPLRLPGHDEVARHLERRPPPEDGLRVLLVGELAFNPERVLALEEAGCRLYGLWIDDPLGFMTVGPLPFGHVEDLPRDDWRRAVRRIDPHVALGLTNWRAVPLVHEVLRELPELPLVWHFKEAPQRSIARGEWPLLAEIERRAAARAYVTEEQRDWVRAVLPGVDASRPTAIVDGDPPPRERLRGDREPAPDGPVRTLLLGRPYGFEDGLRAALAARGIDVVTPPPVQPHEWVARLQGFHAAWLHPVPPANDGDLLRATWDDLNLPARVPTLLAAGLPLLAPRAGGQVHAMARMVREGGFGLEVADADDLAAQLHRLPAARDAAWAARDAFTFDAQLPELLSLLRAVARG